MQSESCLDTDYDNESHVRFVGRSRARHARICYQNPAFATAMQRREQSNISFSSKHVFYSTHSDYRRGLNELSLSSVPRLAFSIFRTPPNTDRICQAPAQRFEA
jgi:hypothetical protein